MRLKIGALLGWGIVIYSVMYFMWSLFVTYGFIEGFAPRLVGYLVLIALGVIAGRSLRASTWVDVLPYSIAWAAIMGVIDAIVSVPFAGWQIYSDPSVWLSYLVVVFSPLLALYPRFARYTL